jgi:uncharacterized protein DUF2336
VLSPVGLAAPLEVPSAAAGIGALVHEQTAAPIDIDQAAAEAKAVPIVHGPQPDGLLDEAQVLDFARTGRVSELLAALARICNVSVEVVQWLITSDSPDAALILCQAAGLSRSTAQAILATGCPVGERAAPALAGPDFCRLSPMTAGRIVGFWSACYGELRAAS